MYKTILTTLENNILVITINRPDKLNAINETVMDELGNVVDEVYKNERIASAIITGSGDRAFVAGADITEFNGKMEAGTSLSRKGQVVFSKIEASPKPFIAAVNGYALGAGCELAMSCQLRVASTQSKFGQPEVNLGLTPGYGGTQRLAQLVGKGRALEMLLTANTIDAATALNWGLANHVTEPGNVVSKAKEILAVINAKAPLAIAGCIEAVNAVFYKPGTGYEIEAKLFGECFATEDLKEGREAFLNKRKANFKGK